VTAKRDSKSKPKKDERPKVEKETLRDLEPEDGAKVAGGKIDGEFQDKDHKT
jgi:hypothetical protein